MDKKAVIWLVVIAVAVIVVVMIIANSGPQLGPKTKSGGKSNTVTLDRLNKGTAISTNEIEQALIGNPVALLTKSASVNDQNIITKFTKKS